MTGNLPSPSPTDNATLSPQPSPRAFAIGTGFVLQTIGTIFIGGSCVFWWLSGRLVAPTTAPGESWLNHLSGDRLPAALGALCILTGVVGGIGLIAAGMGLQGERPSSGRVAIVVTGSMAGIFWLLCFALAFKADAWLAAVVPGALGLVLTVLVLFAAHSTTILARFPPPADQSVVSEEFLAEHASRRRRPRT